MHSTQSRSSIIGRVEELPLSKGDRLRATGYMHDGELIAEFSSRTLAQIQSGAGSLAHAVKAILASTAKHH